MTELCLMDDSSKQAYILEHYKKVANLNGLSGTASMEDAHIRKEETSFILDEIAAYIKTSKTQTIQLLELGCGNGYLLEKIQNKFPQIQLSAIEYSEELYKLARSRKLPNAEIKHGDMRIEEDFPSQQDIIVSERSLINLLSFSEQSQCLKSIFRKLKEGGIYIQVESYIEGLRELNKARNEMNLTQIEASKHNCYLCDQLNKKMAVYGFNQEAVSREPNHLSSYFYLTRIFHKIIRPKHTKSKNTHFVNFFKQAIPPAIGNYSPIQFRVFKKDSNKAEYPIPAL